MESTINSISLNPFIGKGDSFYDSPDLYPISINNSGNVYTSSDSQTGSIYIYSNTNSSWANVFSLINEQPDTPYFGSAISGDGKVGLFIGYNNTNNVAYLTNNNQLALSNFIMNLNSDQSIISLNNNGTFGCSGGFTNTTTLSIRIDNICTICTIQTIPLSYASMTRNAKFIIGNDIGQNNGLNISTFVYENITTIPNSTPYYSLRSHIDLTGFEKVGSNMSISEDGNYVALGQGKDANSPINGGQPCSTILFYKWNGSKYSMYGNIYVSRGLGSDLSLSRNGNYCYVGGSYVSSVVQFKNTGSAFISTMSIVSSINFYYGLGKNIVTNWDGSATIAIDGGNTASLNGNSYVLGFNKNPQPAILPTPTTGAQQISMSADGTNILVANVSTTVVPFLNLYTYSNNIWITRNLINSFADPQSYPSTIPIQNSPMSLSISGNGSVIAYTTIFNEAGTSRFLTKSLITTDNWNSFSTISTFAMTGACNIPIQTRLSYFGNILTHVNNSFYSYRLNNNRWDTIVNLNFGGVFPNTYTMSRSALNPNGDYCMVSRWAVNSTIVLTNGGNPSANYTVARTFEIPFVDGDSYYAMGRIGVMSDDGNYMILTNSGRGSTILFLYWNSATNKYQFCKTASSITSVVSDIFNTGYNATNHDGSIYFQADYAVPERLQIYRRVGSFANAIWNVTNSINYGAVNSLLAVDSIGQNIAVLSNPTNLLFLNTSLTYSTTTTSKTGVRTLSSSSLYLIQSPTLSNFQINRSQNGEFYTLKDAPDRTLTNRISYQPNGISIDNGRASNIGENQTGTSLSFLFNETTNSSYLLNAGNTFRDVGAALVSTLGADVNPTFVSTSFITVNTTAATKTIAIPPGLPDGSFFTIKDIAGGGGGFILAGNQGTTIEGASTSYIFPKNYTSVIMALNSNNLTFLSVNDFAFLTGHPSISPSSYSPSFITGSLQAGVNLVDSSQSTKTFNLPIVPDGSLIVVKDIGGNCLNNIITIQDPVGALTIDNQYSGVAIYNPYSALWLMTAGGKYWLTNVIN